jgi:adenosylhomocysteine nucleosidase
MKIGILTAMPEEFNAAAASLGSFEMTRCGTFRVGQYHSGTHEFILLQTGMGLKNAADATELLVREFHPELLISTGFCGAITGGITVGDSVVAEQIYIADGAGCEEIPVHLSASGQAIALHQITGNKRVVAGIFVSTAVITSKAHLTEMLPLQQRTMTVDMESGAIAIVAAEHNIPLLALRTVSDGASEELGFSLHEFCDDDLRRIRPHKVLLTLLRKPQIIPQLIRLAGGSRRAAENLTATLSHLFSTL